MLHLSNISIHPEYIICIKWLVTKKHTGDDIQPSVAIFLDITESHALDSVLYFPIDSPNAKLLRYAADTGLLGTSIESFDL
jgi:hypothetical protein